MDRSVVALRSFIDLVMTLHRLKAIKYPTAYDAVYKVYHVILTKELEESLKKRMKNYDDVSCSPLEDSSYSE